VTTEQGWVEVFKRQILRRRLPCYGHLQISDEQAEELARALATTVICKQLHHQEIVAKLNEEETRLAARLISEGRALHRRVRSVRRGA
jgi:hypothetical protein